MPSFQWMWQYVVMPSVDVSGARARAVVSAAYLWYVAQHSQPQLFWLQVVHAALLLSLQFVFWAWQLSFSLFNLFLILTSVCSPFSAGCVRFNAAGAPAGA